MNKCEDHRGEITINLEDEQLSTTAEPKKYRTFITYIPVYNTRNDVHPVKILDQCIADTTAKPTQLQFNDFGTNVNLKLSENQSVFNWPYPTNLNLFTGAFFTIIVIIFLWFLIGFNKQIPIDQDPTKVNSLVYIILLYVASTVAGKIISMVSKIPPLVGMILAGIALNISGIDVTDLEIFVTLCFYLSELMESVILIICCLELNVWKLRWTTGVALKLAILPQMAETVAVILVVHYFCPKFINSYFDTFAFVNLSGTNSVLFMINLGTLKHLGYFKSNKIYALLDAASTLIDLTAVIFNYFVVYSSIYYDNPQSLSFENAVLIVAKEISIDIVFGILWGLLIVFVTSPNWIKQYNVQECEDNNNQEINKQITSLLTTVKSVVLFFIGGFLVLLYKISHTTIWSYSLSCGISSLVAGTCWRWRIRYYDNNKVLTMTYDDENEYQNQVFAVLKVFKSIWKYLQPLFFGFVGTSFSIQYSSFRTLYFLPILLVLELIIRVIITTFAVWGSGFNRNELLFINIAWLPNSTLLSGFTAWLMMGALEDSQNTNFKFVYQIYNLTIISNLITTILGSFAVQNYGPTLLSTDLE